MYKKLILISTLKFMDTCLYLDGYIFVWEVGIDLK